MNPFNISDLVKAIMIIILFSATAGKLDDLKRWARINGIKAATYYDYQPNYFFRR